ncbi:hypothetical protein Salat_1986100 [Sesamum alatum]|uniref:RING-type E3 ubiquitin transferase n=1 Tax=Sesamum alatum TaxID=300844 RepID=A0AAE1XZJ0_9LAMI|nr:hypothetical protein Salat_1986100 [Sesamum alatum]
MSSSLFYVSLCFSLLTCISSSSSISYTDHCSTTVPESTTTVPTQIHSIPYFSSSYIIGGDRLLGKKPANQTYFYVGDSVRLRVLPNSYETIDGGVYKVEASLFLRSPYRLYSNRTRGNHSYGGSYYRRSRRNRGSIRFSLSGFWSESSRKLCMVGTASWEFEEGKNVNLDAVLKLHYASENPDVYTSVVSGTLESVGSANDPGYFDPILMFNFPEFPNYNYSLVPTELGGGSWGGSQVVKGEHLSLEPSQFCAVLTWRRIIWELQYAADCRRADQHCSPLGAGDGFLPGFLSLNPIQCSGDERRERYLAMFQNASYADRSFGLNSTLIGEAVWDDENHRLVLAACRVLNPVSHSGSPVGDCTLRLSLNYPSIWTVRNGIEIVGQLWSNRSVEDSGYFSQIDVRSFDETNDVVAYPWLRYEYTELDRARGSCPVKKPGKKRNLYPDGRSYDMRFDMSVKNAKGEQFAWGFAVPISVGNKLYETRSMFVAMAPESAPGIAAIYDPETSSKNGPLNISYRISINPFPDVKPSNLLRALNRSMNLQHLVEITAEGVYNAETGYLCMVGCRKLLSRDQESRNISTDCEILVEVEFAALNAKTGGLTKGTIKSTRGKDDPLHFEDVIMSAAAFYPEMAERSIWRIDLEITMVLISNTLSCIFVVLQLFHVKRNPEALSGISLVMLLILSMGYMIPLVLNFEALFLGSRNKQTLLLSTGGWVEANEVSVRVITMVAFLLQLRLVQLVWTAKHNDGNEKGSWAAETKAAFVSLPMYICGGLLTLLVNWTRNRYGYQAVSSSYNVMKKHSLWGDLRSYAGLILDGFLVPQILLNAFRGSAEKALSHPFYVGISTVRLVPHAYDQYRAHNYPTSYVNGTYYYANPTADFYSTAWDVIIPCGVIALAVIVFVQQRRGGRWIVPQRFRELELYEKVPAVNTE